MRSNHEISDWLDNFLAPRQLERKDLEQILYKYHVTEEEYNDLKLLLQVYPEKAHSSIHQTSWAAVFCLFVAEWYRREYDGSWKWDSIFQILEYSLTPQQSGLLIEKGMNYWNRPIQIKGRGKDYLGSLFFEGGLSWPLLEKNNNAFGRAVQKGLKNHYNYHQERRSHTIQELLKSGMDYLPKAFKNENTAQMLAEIVLQLANIAEKHNFKGIIDPVSFLDEKEPDWCRAFPIPIDKENAKAMLNHWLMDAKKEHEQSKGYKKDSTELTCQHFINGDLSHTDISTNIAFPKGCI